MTADAARNVARRILHGGPASSVPTDPDERALLRAFYALTLLLPGETRFDASPGTAPGESSHGAPPPVSPTQRRTPDADPERTGSQPGSREKKPLRRRGHAERSTVHLPVAAFGALLSALVFIAVLLMLPRPPGFEPGAALYLTGTGAARDARGVALSGGGDLLLFASGLSELERGYRYVAWLVRDGEYERLGTLTTLGAGRARLATRIGEPVSHVEVSIEPAASTGGPGGPTVLAGIDPGSR